MITVAIIETSVLQLQDLMDMFLYGPWQPGLVYLYPTETRECDRGKLWAFGYFRNPHQGSLVLREVVQPSANFMTFLTSAFGVYALVVISDEKFSSFRHPDNNKNVLNHTNWAPNNSNWRNTYAASSFKSQHSKANSPMLHPTPVLSNFKRWAWEDCLGSP